MPWPVIHHACLQFHEDSFEQVDEHRRHLHKCRHRDYVASPNPCNSREVLGNGQLAACHCSFDSFRVVASHEQVSSVVDRYVQEKLKTLRTTITAMEATHYLGTGSGTNAGGTDAAAAVLYCIVQRNRENGAFEAVPCPGTLGQNSSPTTAEP
jgi:hypothetical protein